VQSKLREEQQRKRAVLPLRVQNLLDEQQPQPLDEQQQPHNMLGPRTSARSSYQRNVEDDQQRPSQQYDRLHEKALLRVWLPSEQSEFSMVVH
jgi:hypothetical protein